jgi:hypothetical protein
LEVTQAVAEEQKLKLQDARPGFTASLNPKLIYQKISGS